MKKKIITAVLLVILCIVTLFTGFSFSVFVSETVYEESVSHLSEIFHQANQTLNSLVSVNWSRMNMWAPYLKETQDMDQIDAYIDMARRESSFTDFCFISKNGYYLSSSGNTGYLDLSEKLSDLMIERVPVVANSVVPDQPEIMVFAVPIDHGVYRGFEYDAIAITFNNSDMVEALKISAFDGNASTFAILPDGRVVVDNASSSMGKVRNVLAMLKQHGGMSEEQINQLEDNFRAGSSGSLLFNMNGKSYYLVYEAADFQDWIVTGIVEADIVNANMNRLQYITMFVVSVIAIGVMVVVVVMLIIQNRQKLKEKDHALDIRDALFSKLSENIDDVFIMVDARTLKVEYVSQNVEKLIGVTEASLNEDVHNLESIIYGEDVISVLHEIYSIEQGTQKEWDREYVHQKTGERRWFHTVVLCTEIDHEKKFIMDLSDRTKDRMINLKLEEAAVAAQSANQAKTSFLNNMSHDIRTPMNAIIGFTNIAMKQVQNEEVRNCLHKISSSSEHLLTLINDVLDISRIESGKVKFTPVPVDIRTISDMVCSIMQGFLTNRSIHFETRFDTPQWPYVMADDVRIREVLVNILGNAVKFTEDGGTISFEISYRNENEEGPIYVTYLISDTGVGMSEDFLTHIFDEFSQEANNARTQYRGTGLGMAITKRYVDLMGGTIHVESKKGVGSTFTVELPFEKTDADSVHPVIADVNAVSLDGIRVLLAEDNDLNTEIARLQLEERCIHVTRAVDGQDAVEQFASNPPGTFDLILMDVMMPNKNGYEATKDIRCMDREDAKTIPIIAMTANAFAEDVQASFDAGMDGHIAKPIDMKEVTTAIQRCVHIDHS